MELDTLVIMYIQHLMIFRTFAPAFQKRITDKKRKI